MQALCSLREFVKDLRAMPDTIPQVAEGVLFKSSSEILRQMSNATAGQGPLNPAKLRELIAKASPMFAGNRQQDAHEFLLEYVNQLHDELLGAGRAWQEGRPGEEALGALATQMHLDSELQKTLHCRNCQQTRDVFERFRDFSLDFPPQPTTTVIGSDDRVDLRAMLRSYFEQEAVEATCEHCKNPYADMTKRLTQGPRVLALHLKRFLPNVEKQRYEKQHQTVEIPLRFDLKQCLKDAYGVETARRSLPARPLAAEAGRITPPPLPPPADSQPPVEDCQQQPEFQWTDAAVPELVPIWEVAVESGGGPDGFMQIDATEARCLEEAWHAGQTTIEFEARRQRYLVNLALMEQTNKATNACRPIRRRVESAQRHEDSTMSCEVDSTGGPVYELRSIVAHDGASPHSGHYVCYARGDSGKWRLYDDSLVKELPSEQDLLRNLGRKAYILFYVLQGKNEH